jgi:hypothetical protein
LRQALGTADRVIVTSTRNVAGRSVPGLQICVRCLQIRVTDCGTAFNGAERSYPPLIHVFVTHLLCWYAGVCLLFTLETSALGTPCLGLWGRLSLRSWERISLREPPSPPRTFTFASSPRLWASFRRPISSSRDEGIHGTVSFTLEMSALERLQSPAAMLGVSPGVGTHQSPSSKPGTKRWKQSDRAPTTVGVDVPSRMMSTTL